MEKVCSQCLKIKNIDKYYKHKARKDGHENICKNCKRIKLNKSKKTLESYLNTLSRKEKLKVEELFKIWNDQGGNCYLTDFPMTYESVKNIYNAQIIYLNDDLKLVTLKAKQMIENLTVSQLRKFCHAVLSTFIDI